MPTQAIATPDLDYTTFKNKFSIDSVLLKDLHVNKELPPAINSISCKQGFASTEASQFFCLRLLPRHLTVIYSSREYLN